MNLTKKICKLMVKFITFLLIFTLALPPSIAAHQEGGIIEPPPLKRLFKVGDKAPDFTLTNHKGEKVSLNDWKGKIVILSFISSECTDRMCPILINKYINIQIDLEQEDKLEKEIILAAITVKPTHDTIEVLKKFANEQRIYPKGVHLLTGRPNSTKKILKEYGVLAIKEEKEFLYHHTLTLLIGRDGAIKNLFYSDEAISNEILESVRELLFKK